MSNKFGSLGVRQTGGRRTLEYVEQGRSLIGPDVPTRLIWLRSRWGSDGRSRYSYSLDGTRFLPFGATYQMTRANYRGDRIGVYSYGRSSGGAVDFDYFRYRHQ
jgi:hypothetical protein